jgi:hypothetical protein
MTTFPSSAASQPARSLRSAWRNIDSFNFVALMVAGGITMLLLATLGRVIQLQVAPSPQLQDEMSPRVTAREELPLRGDILDRRGRLLASTKFSRRVVIDPTIFMTHETLDGAIVALAQATGQPEGEITKRIRTPSPKTSAAKPSPRPGPPRATHGSQNSRPKLRRAKLPSHPMHPPRHPHPQCSPAQAQPRSPRPMLKAARSPR